MWSRGASKALAPHRSIVYGGGMERQYAFALTAIAQGRTVLVYKGVTARTAKHVKTSDRLALVDGVMYVDGVSAKGLTICVRPMRS